MKSSFVPLPIQSRNKLFLRICNDYWKDSEWGRALSMAGSLLINSLQVNNYKMSFVNLCIAFEILFTKRENDWAGGTKRMAELIAKSKGETNSIKSAMNTNEDSVRVVRNNIVHGDISFDEDNIKKLRNKLAPWLSKAIISLYLMDEDKIGDLPHVDAIDRISKHRFQDLPNQA